MLVYEELKKSLKYPDADCISDNTEGQDYDVISYNENNIISKDRPQHFTQTKLNDLVRDLGLSKESSELLVSRLNEKNVLERTANFTFYRHRENDLVQYFTQECEFVYCNNVPGLLRKMRVVQYIPCLLNTTRGPEDG